MPQGQIRKGFFFYFGLFVLVLFAVFMVCVVIMIFNPGKSVLWLQYFSSNETKVISTQDSNGTTINWDELEEIDITCSYADVIIEKDDNDSYKQDGIFIKNGAKGFTAASNAVQFSYTATLSSSGKKLTVEVTEPTGFLYFSKSVTIVLHARENSDINFENINIKIITTDGSVNLGGSFNAGTNTELTKIKSVDVTTESGDITITNRLDTDVLKNISLKTTSGDITSRKSVTITTTNEETKTGTGLDVDCPVYFETQKGTIDLNILKVDASAYSNENDVEITCKTGNVAIGYLVADSTMFSSCEQGNYVFTEVYGNLSFGDSINTVISPNITVRNAIYGNFSFYADDDDSAPSLNIAKITGDLIVYADDGNLTVGEVMGEVEVNSRSGGKLSVNLTIADGNNEIIDIQNGSGNIVLTFNGSVSAATGTSGGVVGVVIDSTSGNVTINITSSAKFTATMYDANRNQLDGNSSKIHVEIGNLSGDSNNPLEVNANESGTNGIMTIYTNGSIYFNLV